MTAMTMTKMYRAKRVAGLFLMTIATAGAADAALADTPAIPTTAPLSAGEIVQLLDGRSFQFHNYDRPLTGTTHWDIKAHRVTGDYDYAGIFTGNFQAGWMLNGDQSCTTDKYQGTVCLKIYRYGNGFMEVTDKGKVHAVSVPQ